MSWTMKRAVIAAALALSAGTAIYPATAATVETTAACKVMISKDALEAAVGVKLTGTSIGTADSTGASGELKSRCYFAFANGASLGLDLTIYAD